MTPGKIRATAHRVIGMVILNRNTARIPATGYCENTNKIAEMPRDKNEALKLPIASAKMPPQAFPKTMAHIRIRPQDFSAFQGKSNSMPTYDRKHTTINKLITASKNAGESIFLNDTGELSETKEPLTL